MTNKDPKNNNTNAEEIHEEDKIDKIARQEEKKKISDGITISLCF